MRIMIYILILIPSLSFAGDLERNQLSLFTSRLKMIQKDSVHLDNRVVKSNGYSFDYSRFRKDLNAIIGGLDAYIDSDLAAPAENADLSGDYLRIEGMYN